MGEFVASDGAKVGASVRMLGAKVGPFVSPATLGAEVGERVETLGARVGPPVSFGEEVGDPVSFGEEVGDPVSFGEEVGVAVPTLGANVGEIVAFVTVGDSVDEVGTDVLSISGDSVGALVGAKVSVEFVKAPTPLSPFSRFDIASIPPNPHRYTESATTPTRAAPTPT